MKAETKNCQNCKKDFTITPDDFGFYEKIGVPAPELCWSCRYQRRIAGRNEWVLYFRNCSKCEQKMVSIYEPGYAGSVYCLKCFWNDDWDRLATGADFDFSRPFFEQFKELRDRTPKVTLAHFRCVNSSFSNQSQDLKNCYMVFSTDASEDCMYGNWFFSCKRSMDCSIVHRSELLYECLNTLDSYNCSYLTDCKNCIDSYFLKDCRNCINCFGCVNLRGKSNCFFNEQLAKEEYEKKLREFEWSIENIEKTRKQVKEFSLKYPEKFYKGYNVVNSTGDYIYDLRNSCFGFNSNDLENVSYSQDVEHMKDGRDITEAAYNELDYEIEGIGYSFGNIAVSRSFHVTNCFYSYNCFSTDDCFGCVSLNKSKYCILNKQYSKQEYLSLKKKIIEHMKKTGEWGNFFPVEISPFAYNETVAQEYFPMSKTEVLSKGWRWHERGERDYKPTILQSNLPKTIKEINDSILQETISCLSHDTGADGMTHSNCTQAFRITQDELSFYRLKGLPIPHKCFMCRFQDRLRQRTPRNLWHRSCMCDKESHGHAGKCPNEFETSYEPERHEIIYCESCYQKEVY